MFNTLKRLYEQGNIDDNGLTNAVMKGWLTEEQAKEINSNIELRKE